MFGQMLRIRRAEERVLELLLENRLSSTMCHVSIGQEAVAVGVCDALGPDDYVSSTHRGHGHYLARGGPLVGLIAELMGREAGACRGRGGSMHLVDARTRASRLERDRRRPHPDRDRSRSLALLSGTAQVCVASSATAASTRASSTSAPTSPPIWKLPVVYVLENNQFAMSLPWEPLQLGAELSVTASGLGIPGVESTAMDVLAVERRPPECRRAGAAWRRADLPGATTYRFLGHRRADSEAYRDKTRKRAGSSATPLSLARRALGRGRASADEAELEALEATIARELDAPSPRPRRAPQRGRRGPRRRCMRRRSEACDERDRCHCGQWRRRPRPARSPIGGDPRSAHRGDGRTTRVSPHGRGGRPSTGVPTQSSKRADRASSATERVSDTPHGRGDDRRAGPRRGSRRCLGPSPRSCTSTS